MEIPVQQLFNRIAPTYDRLNHLLSFGIDHYWRRRLTKKLPSGNIRVLDVATGTGDVLFDIVRHHPHLTQAVGVDISEGLLTYARKKALAVSTKTKFIQGDVHALPFDSGSFDVVTVAFGVRNFSERKKALKEISRILTPDGTLLILELGLPENRLISLLYRPYFAYIIPLVGKIISRDSYAYTYLHTSVRLFPKPDVFKNELTESGFHEVSFKRLTGGIATLYQAKK